MRRHRAGVLVVLMLAAGGHSGAEDSPGATGTADRAVRIRLPPGQDAYFATNHYTGMGLLHFRKDGTYAAYGREHLFVAQGDEGRWRQTAGGRLLLCSHFHFTPIRAGALTVYPRADDVKGLPSLLAAIEGRLSALPARRDFAYEDLRPVVVRWFLAMDDAAAPAGGLSPTVDCRDRRVSREGLEELANAIREYMDKGSGNLTSHVVKQYRKLVWLAEGHFETDAYFETKLLEAYRSHGEGPFLPNLATVAVDGGTFADLLGTTQPFILHPEMNVRIPRRALLSDFRRGRVDAPLCGEFGEGAAALPEDPQAVAAPLPAGEDMGFARDGASGPSLLLLGADGRFSRYARSENESTLVDQGDWIQGADGSARLCSNVRFRSVKHERLFLPVDEAMYSKLPALLASLRALLATHPTSASFATKELEGVARRTLPATGPGEKDCARLVGGEDPVERRDVEAFVAALDEYLRSGTANLVEHRLWRHGTTTWLGDPAGLENAAVVGTLRALGEGPCLLPGVLVRLPLWDFLDMRGPTVAPTLSKRIEAPLCSGFSQENPR
jgi:hypothetical protein